MGPAVVARSSVRHSGMPDRHGKPAGGRQCQGKTNETPRHMGMHKTFLRDSQKKKTGGFEQEGVKHRGEEVHLTMSPKGEAFKRFLLEV